MMSLSASWRPFAISAFVLGVSALSGGCTPYANRPQPTANRTSISAKPQTKPSTVMSPVDVRQQERELEAQNARLQAKITHHQNELEELVLKRIKELDEEFGEQQVDVHSEGNVVRANLELMVKERADNLRESVAVKTKLRALDAGAKEGKTWPGARETMTRDPRYQALRQRLDAMDVEIAGAPNTTPAEKDALGKLQHQRDALQKKLDQVSNDMIEEITENYRRDMEERYVLLDQRQSILTEIIADTGKQLGKINQMKTEYLALKEDEKARRDEIRSLQREREGVLDKMEGLRRAASSTN